MYAHTHQTIWHSALYPTLPKLLSSMETFASQHIYEDNYEQSKFRQFDQQWIPTNMQSSKAERLLQLWSQTYAENLLSTMQAELVWLEIRVAWTEKQYSTELSSRCTGQISVLLLIRTCSSAASIPVTLFAGASTLPCSVTWRIFSWGR